MKPQKQRFKHDPENGVYGDCHRTAIATVLGIDRDDVPHFGDGDPPAEEFFRREAEFLKRFNLRTVVVPFGDKLQNVLDFAQHANGDTPYLLGGTSKTGVHHTVVGRGNAIAHDPSTTDAGIVAPCKDGYYWLSFFVVDDLAAHVARHHQRGAA